jgi:hypothetical protein
MIPQRKMLIQKKPPYLIPRSNMAARFFEYNDIIFRCGFVMWCRGCGSYYICIYGLDVSWKFTCSCSGDAASVEVVVDAAWDCYISMHLLLTPSSRLRAEHSASNMGLREVYALRAISFLLFSMHLLQYSTCSRPSSMFSSRQSKCSWVWNNVNVLVCRLATLCRFDFAKLQRELLSSYAKKQPLAI